MEHSLLSCCHRECVMSAIEGTWKLDSSTNIDAFYGAINSPEPFKSKVLAMKEAARHDPSGHFEELGVDPKAGKIVRRIFVNGEQKFEMEFEIGPEKECLAPDGRKATSRCELIGDSKITFNTKGEGFEMQGTMEVEGNKLTMTIVGNGVTATEHFVKT